MNLALSMVPQLIRERDSSDLRFVIRIEDGTLGQVINRAFDGWLYVIWAHSCRVTTFIHPDRVLWIRPSRQRRPLKDLQPWWFIENY